MLGLAEGVFNATLPYIYQRKQFGQVCENSLKILYLRNFIYLK